MSRPTKHSSGFFEEQSDNIKHLTAMNKESSSTSDEFWRHNNGNGARAPSSPSTNGHVEDDGEIVEIVDSDDEVARDNNNEAASPDRHRNYEQCDSEETVRQDSDGSDDDVVVLETSDDETVKLSKIKSYCK